MQSHQECQRINIVVILNAVKDLITAVVGVITNNKILKLVTKYKNFFFDLDGTLTDPKEGIVNSYIYSLKKFGITNCNRELISTYIGSSIHLLFAEEYGISECNIDSAVKYYR